MKLLKIAYASVTMLFLAVCINTLSSQTVSAAASPTGANVAGCAGQGIKIIPPWYKYIERSVDDTGHCGLNFDFPNDLGLVALALVEILLRIAAIVAVAYIVYAGFLYITSQGEPDKAKSAQQTITNAVIGLIVSILATGIVAFIGSRLTS